MAKIELNALRQTNPLVHNPESPVTGSLVERIVTVSLPILQMCESTKSLATAIGGIQTISVIGFEVYAAYQNGQKARCALALGKGVLATISIAAMILYPFPTALLIHTYYFAVDFNSLVSHIASLDMRGVAQDLLSILHKMVYAGAALGATEFIVLSLLMQAAKELYQSRQEFNSGRYLEGFANIIYAMIRLIGAKPHIAELLRKDVSQEDLDQLLAEAAQILSEKPNQMIDFGQLIRDHGYKIQFKHLQFQDKRIESIAFKNLMFENVTIKDCEFNKCLFEDTQFYKMRVADTLFNLCTFNNTTLNGIFTELVLHQCAANKLRLDNSTFYKGQFINSTLIDSDLTESLFEQSRFEHCDLSRSAFNDSRFVSSSFKSSILSEASFFDVTVESTTIEKSELKNCLFFDSIHAFTIQGSTKHEMTKPVIAMPWIFNGPGTLIANAMKESIQAEGGIVFRLKFKYKDSSKIDAEATKLLGKIKTPHSIPQELLKQAAKNGRIEKIKGIAAHAGKYIDALFLPGGEDIEPSLYGATEDYADVEGFSRSITEIALLNEAMNRKLPVMGVCRGSQMINVFLGGTLKQHIEGHFGETHELSITPEMRDTSWGQMAYDILQGDQVIGLSMHHQAVDKPGYGVNPVLTHDGDVEMHISQDGLFVGTQFHPEVYRFDYVQSHFQSPKFNPPMGREVFMERFNANRNIYKNFVAKAYKSATLV